MAEKVNQKPTSVVEQINEESGLPKTIQSFLKTDVRFNSASIPHKFKDNNTNQTYWAAFENYFYEIQDPAWYPDSLIRSRKQNLYNHMLNVAKFKLTYDKFKTPVKVNEETGQLSGAIKGISDDDANKIENSNKALDFYFQGGDEGLGKIVNNICKSVVSYAYSQVSGIVSAAEQIPGMFSTAKGFLQDSGIISKDGKKTTETKTPGMIYTPESLFLTTQPMIDVQGIMTNERLLQQLKVGETAVKMLMDIIHDKSIDDNFFKNMFDNFEKMMKELVYKIILPADKYEEYKDKGITDIISACSRPDVRLHGVAEKIFMTMIYGNYKAHFRIPMTQTQYQFGLAEGNKGWVAADSSLIKGAENTTDIINSFSEVNMPNVFMRRQWKQDRHVNGAKLFSCSFYLFNDTLDHFMLNFNYIIHLLALCNATTDTIFVRPPYLFNLRIPGGLRYLLCSCTCRVDGIGKIRKLGSSDYVVNILKHITEQFVWNEGLAGDELTYCPDAYKVTLNFTSLMPNTWNFDQAYLTNIDIGVPKYENQPIGWSFS